MNRAIAFDRLQRQSELDADLAVLDTLAPAAGKFEPVVRLGIAILRKQDDVTLGLLATVIRGRLLTEENFGVFPIFDTVRDDPKIKAAVQELFKDRKAGKSHSSPAPLPSRRRYLRQPPHRPFRLGRRTNLCPIVLRD
jgi:hypothetical protein